MKSTENSVEINFEKSMVSNTEFTDDLEKGRNDFKSANQPKKIPDSILQTAVKFKKVTPFSLPEGSQNNLSQSEIADSQGPMDFKVAVE